MVTQYFTASSLDGFIAAEPEDGLAWLLTRQIDQAGPQGYEAFIAEVGALVMGSTTYQWLLDHDDGPWPYAMPTWVLTHRDFPAPEGDVRFTDAPVPQVHAAMVEAAGEKNVWLVGGGDLVGQFHDHGLLDEVWIQYAPLTLGSGAPLLPRRIEFESVALDENGEFACRRLRVLR
ncbi:dihydrofolate reductase family protein [Marmoricola sp. RAF53]|uniref:dihydrofolate reductase family protein n=1 Tax=Marmoricola sp. RAF53 TaxID=3233059 RepID=UPI003F949E2F